MTQSRRNFLRASGVSALLGLAGCTGVLEGDESMDEAGGPPEYTTWMYDPKDLLGVETRGFASYDVESVMEQRDELPQDPFQGLEQANQELEGVDLTEIGHMTAVGGTSLNFTSGSSGSTTAGASFVIEGSFDVDTIKEEIESESDSDVEYETGSYQGYDLYYGEDGSDYSETSYGFALDSEHVVFGFVEDDQVTGRAAVEAMIDANSGDTGRYYEQSEYAQILVDKLGNATMVMGAQFDLGTVVRDQIQDERARQLVDGLYAAGVAGTLDGETSENEVLFVYDEETEPPEDVVRDLLEEAREQSPQAFEHIEDVSVNGGDRTLTITMTVNTTEFWNNYQEMSGVSGSASGSSSSDMSDIPSASFDSNWEETSSGGRVMITHRTGESIDADRLSLQGDVQSSTGWRNTSGGDVVVGSYIEADVESGGYVSVVWEDDDGTSVTIASFVNPH